MLLTPNRVRKFCTLNKHTAFTSHTLPRETTCSGHKYKRGCVRRVRAVSIFESDLIPPAFLENEGNIFQIMFIFLLIFWELSQISFISAALQTLQIEK